MHLLCLSVKVRADIASSIGNQCQKTQLSEHKNGQEYYSDAGKEMKLFKMASQDDGIMKNNLVCFDKFS